MLSLLALSVFLHAEEERTERPRFTSPDKQWEFRVADEKAVLVRVESGETALDLSEEIGYLALETGKLVWAQDSRRFAFNSRKGGKYYGCDLYELAGTTWEKLPSLEENQGAIQTIERSLNKQAKRLGARHPSLNTVMGQWRVRRWSDNDTFEAYADDQRRFMLHEKNEDWEYVGCAIAFRANATTVGIGKCS